MQPNVIAERLIKLRGGRSQAQVSKDIGISDSALSMYERGDRIPRDAIKIKIAEYYGQTVQSIFFNQQCHEK